MSTSHGRTFEKSTSTIPRSLETTSRRLDGESSVGIHWFPSAEALVMGGGGGGGGGRVVQVSAGFDLHGQMVL